MHKLQRRAVIFGLTAALVHGAAPVWALSTAQAKALVGRVVDDINRVIQSGQSEPVMWLSSKRFLSATQT